MYFVKRSFWLFRSWQNKWQWQNISLVSHCRWIQYCFFSSVFSILRYLYPVHERENLSVWNKNTRLKLSQDPNRCKFFHLSHSMWTNQEFLAISHLSITISAPFLFISGFLLSISDVSYQLNKPVIFRLAVKFFTDIPLSVKAHPHRLILQVTVAYLPIIYRRIPKLRWTGICF